MIAKRRHTGTAAQLFEAKREDLVTIIVEHALDHFRGGGGQTTVSLHTRKVPARDQRGEQNLQVDFMVRHIDAGGIVDGVIVDSSAVEREFDSGLLGEAEVAALDDYLAAQFRPGDTDVIVGMVADFSVAFAAGAYVST